MEILSTGEKIKRARVYKGITLKELCGDKISISKMSCIENGKVKADEDIIRYVADKIDIDFDYLYQDVYEQVVNNLDKLKKCKNKDSEFEENIRHNLEYSLDYKYYDLAFDLIHLVFTYYLEEKKYEKIQLIVSQYYDLYHKTNNEKNTLVYFRDMAKYLFQNQEYTEAIAYYGRVREFILGNSVNDKALYSYLSFKEGICYAKLRKFEEAYELLSEAVKYAENIKDDSVIGKVYQAYALLCIRLKSEDASEYIKKAYEYQKEDYAEVAASKSQYGEAYFYSNEQNKAIEEILEGVKIFPSENEIEYVKFLIENIEILYNNKKYEEAYELTDTALNLAISTDDINLIERVYYYKGSILQKQNQYIQAEMYMNLALDLLMKFGTKEDRYNRYLEMGNMYYNLGEIKDSAKYFDLAVRMNRDE